MTATTVLSTAELRKRAKKAADARIVRPGMSIIVQPPVDLDPDEVLAIANELDRLRLKARQTKSGKGK